MPDRVAARIAFALVLLYAVLTAAGLSMAARNGRVPEGAVLHLGMVAFALVGGVVASRRPRNPIGWLILMSPLAAGVGLLAQETAIYGHVTAPGTAPLVGVASWISMWFWMAMLAPLVFVVFLFPTGRLPSTQLWRLIPIVVAIAFTFFTVVFAFGTPSHDAYPQIANPLAVPALVPLAVLLADTFWVFIVVLALAVASIVARYRTASSSERQQIKWILAAGVFMVVAFTGADALPWPLNDALWMGGFIALPLAIGIAILFHRLYDIDILINRTIVYTGVTVALGATFFVGLVILQGLLRPITGANELGVALSTLVSFTLFQPFRRGIQTGVDRRFNRHKYDAERTLEDFTSRLGDELDLDALRGDLVAVVRGTMSPAHVSLWLRERLS